MTCSFPPFVLGSWRLALVFSLLLLPSCGSSTEPEEPPISGIARTGSNWMVVEDDPLDWQPRMVEPISGSGNGSGREIGGLGGVIEPPTTNGIFALIPAFPNPALSETAIQLVLVQKAQVRIWIVNSNREKVKDLVVDEGLDAGQYRFDWEVKASSGEPLVPPGLYRVYFSIKYGRTLTEIRSFGDVEVQ